MTTRLVVSVGSISLIALSLLVASFPLASAQSTTIITIPKGSGFPAGAPGYAPDNATVVIGVNNTVEWVNNDTVAHTVTPEKQPSGGNWPAAGSGNLAVNATYTFTFTVPGTYTYNCLYHSWMSGTLTVLPATHTTAEFPTAALAVVLFAVIAAVIVAAPRLKPKTVASTAPPAMGA
jgi:plastocyanin